MTGLIPLRIGLYRIAFIHKSVSHIVQNGNRVHNERLEYLGDAILDAVIAEYLYQVFPDKDEGFLTQLRSKIVKRKQLNKLADKLGIDRLLKANTNDTNVQKNIYGNALEALIGAVYLDKGYRRTKAFIINRILERCLNLEKLSRKESDFKSRLIEWAQKNKKEISFISKESISEIPVGVQFRSTVIMMSEILGEGTGHSKKEAEQKAAEQALGKLTTSTV